MLCRYLRVDELPPKPGSAPGAYPPPHAPGWVSQGGPHSWDRDPFLKPEPPPGQDAVVAWYSGNRRIALYTGAAWAVIVPVLFSLINGLRWTAVWQMWVIFAVGLCGLYRAGVTAPSSVGLDWVARGRSWVSTYELKSVSMHSRPGGARLYLRDQHGRRLSIKIDSLYGDRTIWDLTYNGILHSVIAGDASTNKRVHLDLHVPHPAPDAKSGSPPAGSR